MEQNMAPLINLSGLVSSDPWRCVGSEEELDEAKTSLAEHLILSLALWQSHGQTLAAMGHNIGVWLSPADEPEELVSALASMPVVAVQFPSFTDGRGYSQGRILRERMGYTGDLRAMGDILRDQIYLLHRCGFSSFALRADQSPEEALAALKDFSWSPVRNRSPSE
jgi:uncharacterized protein (DUF934 family)